MTPEEKRQTEEALGVSPDMSLTEKLTLGLVILVVLGMVAVYYFRKS